MHVLSILSLVLLTCASQKEEAQHRKMARMPVLQPTLLFDPILQDLIFSECRRCAPEDGTNANAATARLNLCVGIPVRLLSTPTCCWWATLAFIAATPSLLCHGPTCHPICETSIAIVWLGRRHTAAALIRASLAVDSAAPFLLGH